MNKQRLFASQLPILLLGVIIGIFASITLPYVSKNFNFPTQRGCTLEAKLCPDGSTVGRIGPNCEFASCPAVSPTQPPSAANVNCSSNDDCVLVNRELGVDCCYTNGCEAIDYSLGKWIAVSSEWYDKQRENNCPKSIGCPNCAPKPINENFKAVCQNGVCQKASL